MPTKLFRLLLYFSYFYLSIVFDKNRKNAREFRPSPPTFRRFFVKQNSFAFKPVLFK